MEDEKKVDPAAAPLIDDGLLEFLAQAADGDARTALNSLEMALATVESGTTTLNYDDLKESLRKAHLLYDRAGDAHYDTISCVRLQMRLLNLILASRALHKSVRGSDANAALYWLARMLEGGEDPLYVARRVVRMVSRMYRAL